MRALAAAALLFLAGSPAAADRARLLKSVMIDWAVSNCGREGIPGDLILKKLEGTLIVMKRA
jgi:hypothetical protein